MYAYSVIFIRVLAATDDD